MSSLQMAKPTTRHVGNLVISKTNANAYVHLIEITGDLSVEAEAQLPALTSVGGDLYVRAEAQLPALTSVGGDLYVEAEAQLPALTSVGAFLGIKGNPTKTAARERLARLMSETIEGGDLRVAQAQYRVALQVWKL